MEIVELVDRKPPARGFKCTWEECTKDFTRNSDLQRHYRIHTNDRPFSCSVPGCGGRFTQRSALTVHFRTHTGEKPYECKFPGCTKRFADSSSFCRHRRLHVGRRPYTCPVESCRKLFVRKAAMIRHYKGHAKGSHSGNTAAPHGYCNSQFVAAPAPPSESMSQQGAYITWICENPKNTTLSGCDKSGVERSDKIADCFSDGQTQEVQEHRVSTASWEPCYDWTRESSHSSQVDSLIDDNDNQGSALTWPLYDPEQILPRESHVAEHQGWELGISVSHPYATYNNYETMLPRSGLQEPVFTQSYCPGFASGFSSENGSSWDCFNL